MDEMAVEDRLEAQERMGTGPELGLTVEKFYQFCEDIREQPNWRPRTDKAADYYDGNQLDAATLHALEEKGMGALISNLIKPSIDMVLGMEAKTRGDWRVTADDDSFVSVAEAISQKLHEAERESRADRACSDAYAGQVKAGIAWAEVSRNADPFKYPYRCAHVHRREIYWDWRARDYDTNEGRYLIRRRWFDLDELEAYLPGKRDLIKAAGNGWGPWFIELESGGGLRPDLAQSFDQESRYYVEDLEWRDVARRRACLFEAWYRKIQRGYVLRLPDERVVELNLHNPAQAAAIARGILKPVPAVYSKWNMALFMGPHKLGEFVSGRKRHPYIPFWGFREDLTGVPYGLIHCMISPQDEVNARRQKMMWQLSAKRVIADSDALDQKMNTTQEMLDEISRPDAAVFLNPQRKNRDQYAFRVESEVGLSQQQFRVMLNSEQTIQKVAGIFNAMLGREDRASAGVAIDALIEQGSTVLAEINDNYRYSRRLVGEAELELVREDLMGKQVEIMVGDAPKRRTVILNRPAQDAKTGLSYLENDTSRAPVKVSLEDVPSSPSYRQQLFVMMSEVLKAMPPQVQAVLTPFWLESSDHPKRKEMAEQVRIALGLQTADGERPITAEQVQLQITQAVEAALARAGVKYKDAELQQKDRELGIKEREVESRVALAESKAKEAEARAEQARQEGDRKMAELVLSRLMEDMRGEIVGITDNVRQARSGQERESTVVTQAVADVTNLVESLTERVEALKYDQEAAGEERSDGLKTLSEQISGLRDELSDLKAEASKKPEPVKQEPPVVNVSVQSGGDKTVEITGPGGKKFVGTVKQKPVESG